MLARKLSLLNITFIFLRQATAANLNILKHSNHIAVFVLVTNTSLENFSFSDFSYRDDSKLTRINMEALIVKS